MKPQHHIGKQRVVLQNLVIRFSGDLDLKPRPQTDQCCSVRCPQRTRPTPATSLALSAEDSGRYSILAARSHKKNGTSVHLYAHTKRLAETVEVLRIHLNAEGLSSLCIVERLCFAARALIKLRPIEVEGAGARTDLNGTVELRLRLR